jgi:hypothetical protein
MVGTPDMLKTLAQHLPTTVCRELGGPWDATVADREMPVKVRRLGPCPPVSECRDVPQARRTQVPAGRIRTGGRHIPGRPSWRP